MKTRFRRTPHTVYELKYHFVFVPKYRYAVLEGKVKQIVKEAIGFVCQNMDIIVESGEICKDHVHLFLSIPPKHSPSEVMKQIKSISAQEVFERAPEIKEKYWGQHFWARGFCVSTVGIDEETIRKYIANQQREEENVKKQLKLLH